MSNLSNVIDRLRMINPEALLHLRPPYPPVALGVDRDEAVLVRVKKRRRAKPVLEAWASRPLAERCIPTSIFESVNRPTGELIARLRELFEVSGTRPGRVSLVVPDNLAKISLLHLPERPASSRQLDQLVRSKMRRAVPFRLDEARLSYQLLAGQGRGIGVLVVLVRKALVEGFEQSLGSLGARVGLIDICTPNLMNLARGNLDQASRERGDIALFNCGSNYFSLVILREGRLIFFRCKTFASGRLPNGEANGELGREIASSLSYYREKLEGKGIETVFVRSLGPAVETIDSQLRQLEVQDVRLLDPLSEVELPDGGKLEPDVVQRIAPVVGAAAGRTH